MVVDPFENRYLPPSLYPMQSHHKKEIEAFFPLRSVEGDADLKASLEGVKPTFICFTNRVGSNLLTSFLFHAGFGVRVAEEDFNSATVITASKDNGFGSFTKYLAHMCRKTQKNNTLFMKIGAPQLLWLANRGIVPDFFPNAKYIFVRRKDRIAQAVSLYIMNQTGKYLAHIPAKTDREPDFNKEKIAESLNWILANEKDFEYFFSLHKISPLIVWYEDMLEDAPNVVRNISTFCGLESVAQFDFSELDPANAKVKSQHSDINEQFIAEMRRAFSLRSTDGPPTRS